LSIWLPVKAMKTVAKTTSEPLVTPDKIIWIMPLPGVATRLARALADTAQELSNGSVSYLRAALLPDRARDWFPIRVTRLILGSAAHPIEIIRGVVAADAIDLKRRRRLLPILSISAGVHGALIIYLIYLAFFSAFAHVRVVNKAYRQFDPNALLVKLYYPPQLLRQAQQGPAMTLEEIRARAEKHKQELALAKEKAEKEKKEKEEADRKAAEEAAKVAAQNKPSTPTQFGEINEAPIKDTVATLYQLFQAGGLDIPEMKFSVMAGFKVEPDGSLSNIHIKRPSESKIIDTKALEILWKIGESHALGPVSDLTSATISLDVTDDVAVLRVTAFAPTPEIAKQKSDLLGVLFWALRMKEKSPDVAQLLSLIKVNSDGKRVDTVLRVPRAKAAEMMRARFEHPGTPPNE
jgi:hypothetical protein